VIEYISFVATFNLTAILMRKYRSPWVLLTLNILITLIMMLLVEAFGGD